MTNIVPEENPYEEERVATEWINSVENEQGLVRDKEIYPLLKTWSETVQGVIVDVGSGQGICSEKITLSENSRYIGVEPSTFLVKRAQEKYQTSNREFVVGNAYGLPLKNDYADGLFSINVWFHLENLKSAAREMARVLKKGGKFFIVTANPEAQKKWEAFYYDQESEGKKIVGKAHLPINPLSRNTFYKHTEKEIIEALEEVGFSVSKKVILGKLSDSPEGLFLSISGIK